MAGRVRAAEELPLIAVDPGALLRGVVEADPAFQFPRMSIEVAGRLPRVLANPAGLTQCFSSLLDDAAKFAKPGAIPRVRVRAQARGELVRLWIEDQGIGIPREHHERVFRMFERLHARAEGTGIGLALVRKVVERMGGRVGLESEEGSGSRFWIELRRAPPGAA